MNNIFPRISLFDTLAMMIPGGATLAILISCCGYNLQIEKSIEIEEWIIYTNILVVCYLLGNIVNVIMDIIWYPIRNNPIFLKISQYIYNCSLQVNDIYRNIALFTCSIVTIGGLTTVIYYTNCIIILFAILPLIFILWIFQLRDNKQITKEYYKQYYYVAKNSTNNTISIIEAQIAFMRNMLFPLIMFSILNEKTLFPDYFPELNKTGLIVAGSFLLFVTIIIRQHKVYVIVWEDYKYFNALKEQEKNSQKH